MKRPADSVIYNLYYNENKSMNDIGEQYGVSGVTIRKVFRRNGWKARKPYELEQKVFNKQELVNLYNNGALADDIASKYGITISHMYKILKDCGADTDWSRSRTHKLNENFFSFWNPLMAYWLGFLCADGGTIRNALTISLKESDKNHLDKFIEDVESDYNVVIKERKSGFGVGLKYCKVQVNSKTMLNKINELGFGDFKKGGLKLIENIPTCLFSHWLRGMTDGDGTISIINSKGKRYPVWNLVGPYYEQLKLVGEIVSEQVDISPINVYKSKTIYVITAKKKKGKKVMDYIYKNNIRSLDRKREKFEIISNEFYT